MKILNKSMLKNASQVAKTIRARAVFLYVDCIDDEDYSLDLPKGCDLIAVTKKHVEQEEEFSQRFPKQVILPKIKLGRIGLIKVSLAFAISTHLVGEGDKVVFLCGTSELMSLDTLTVFEIGKESEIISTKNIMGISESVQPQVFEATLNLAIELAVKGREGKPLGTIFVIGDEERVMQLSKQMIINPFKGYDEEERNILNPHLKETIREFSALDGAFVIGNTGTVITAGRFLGATADSTDVTRGLGSRHLAAAGITALTNSLAIVISESTGDIRIYKNGTTLMEIEKP
jgi:DNA integrity scanning protein DisA with diadenylate cyclase activity